MACVSNGEFEVATADVKDEPEDEKVAIMCGGKSYKLLRCLPGQRTAANRWYVLFRDSEGIWLGGGHHAAHADEDGQEQKKSCT